MATAPRQTVGDLGVEILAEGGLGVIVEPQILEEEPPSVKGGIVQTGVRVPGPTLTGVPLIKPFRVEDVEARYRELAAKEPQTLWGQVLKEMSQPPELIRGALDELDRLLVFPPVVGDFYKGVLRAGAEIATTPLNWLIAGGIAEASALATAAKSPLIGAAWEALDTALAAYFAGAFGTAAYDQGKMAVEALQQGQYETAAAALGVGSVDTLFAVLGGKRAIAQGVDIGRGIKLGVELGRARVRLQEEMNARYRAQQEAGGVTIQERKMLPAPAEEAKPAAEAPPSPPTEVLRPEPEWGPRETVAGWEVTDPATGHKTFFAAQDFTEAQVLELTKDIPYARILRYEAGEEPLGGAPTEPAPTAGPEPVAEPGPAAAPAGALVTMPKFRRGQAVRLALTPASWSKAEMKRAGVEQPAFNYRGFPVYRDDSGSFTYRVWRPQEPQAWTVVSQTEVGIKQAIDRDYDLLPSDAAARIEAVLATQHPTAPPPRLAPVLPFPQIPGPDVSRPAAEVTTDLSVAPVVQTDPLPGPEGVLDLFDRVEAGTEPELRPRKARAKRSAQKQSELATEQKALEEQRLARPLWETPVVSAETMPPMGRSIPRIPVAPEPSPAPTGVPPTELVVAVKRVAAGLRKPTYKTLEERDKATVALEQKLALPVEQALEEAGQGIVYHGTILTHALAIAREGFQPLTLASEVDRVASMLGVDPKSLKPAQKRALKRLLAIYETQEGTVSVTPWRPIASRWAGQGGEIARQIEEILTGRTKKRWWEREYRVSGDPVILKLRFKQGKLPGRHARDAERYAAGDLDLTDVQYTYWDIRAKPQELEVVDILDLAGNPIDWRQALEIAPARTPEGGLKIGISPEESAKLLGSALYGGRKGTVVTRELLQNAFDAAKQGGGNIWVSVSPHKYGGPFTLTVEDDGPGMTPQQLETVFTDLFASGKRKEAGAAGGFGVAKAGFLLQPESVELLTKAEDPRTGQIIETRLLTNAAELMAGTAKEQSTLLSPEVSRSSATGTRITVTLPGDTWYDVLAMLDLAERHVSEGVTLYRDGIKTTKGLPEQPWKHHPGFDLQVRYGPERIISRSTNFTVANQGVPQFTGAVFFGARRDAPEHVLVNISPTVEEGDPNYPFTLNREALSATASDLVQTAVTEVITATGKTEVELMNERLSGLPTVDTPAGPVMYYDADGDVDASKLPARVRRLFGIVVRAAKTYSDWLVSVGKLGGVAEFRPAKGTGILFSTGFLGLNIPTVDGKATTILIDPLHMESITDPVEMAALTAHLIRHELTHNMARGEGSEFTYALARVEAKLATFPGNRALLEALREVYANEDGSGLHTDIVEAIKTVRAARGRSPNDPLGLVRGGQGLSVGPKAEPGAEGGVPQAVPGAGTEAVQGAARQFDWEAFYRGREAELNKEYFEEVEKVWDRPVEEVFPDLAGQYPEGTKVSTAYFEGAGPVRERLDFARFLERKAGRSASSDASGDALQQAAEANSPEQVQMTKVGKRLAEFGGLTGEAAERFVADMGSMGWYAKRLYSLQQVGLHNPDAMPYVHEVQRTETTRAEVRRWGLDVHNELMRLGKRALANVADLLLAADRLSTLKKRRLTEDEIRQLAISNGVGEAGLEAFRAVDELMRSVLNRIYANLRVRIEREWAGAPETIPKRLADLEAERQRMLNRNFFPLSRFGKYVIVVRARKNLTRKVTEGGEEFELTYRGPRYDEAGREVAAGETVSLEAFENKGERDRRLREVQREYPTEDYEVHPDQLTPAEYVFQGFSPVLLDIFAQRAELTPAQAEHIRQLRFDMAPGRSFVKHLRRRRGVAGASHDVSRVLIDYMLSAAGYIARMEHMDDTQRALAAYHARTQELLRDGHPEAEKRREVYVWLSQHYRDLMKPQNDLPVLRSAMTVITFGFFPVQAFVNMTQPVLVTMPWLVETTRARLGSTEGELRRVATARKYMNQAAWDVIRSYRFWRGFELEKMGEHLTPDEQAAVAQGVKDTFLNESMAMEMAAAAHGGILHRMLPVSTVSRIVPQATEAVKAADRALRYLMHLSLRFFALGEELNRFQAFIAAYRLARDRPWEAAREPAGAETYGPKGYDGAAYQYGRAAVDETHFEYGVWNRAKWMRGAGAAILQFMTYNLGMLHLIFRTPLAARLLGMLAIISGGMGLPFAEDIEGILSTILTHYKKWLGMPQPYTSLKREAREFLNSVGADPDLFMHGLSSGTMGLYYLDRLLGSPLHVPKLDLSPSLSMGRMLRGARPALETLSGLGKGTETAMRVGEELLGPSVGVMTTMLRGMLDKSANGLWRARMLAPRIGKSMLLGYEAATTGMIRGKDGTPLMFFDTQDPEQWLEVASMFFGIRPRDLNLMQEKHYQEIQVVTFYNAWRTSILDQAAIARRANDGKGDPEAMAEANRERQKYNRLAPPGRALTAVEFAQGIRERIRSAQVQDLPAYPVKEWRRYLDDLAKAYPNRGRPPRK